MNAGEIGTCDICGKRASLSRTYYNYEIACECHSPYHFELILHCKNCTPKEPAITTIKIKTKELKKVKESNNAQTNPA